MTKIPTESSPLKINNGENKNNGAINLTIPEDHQEGSLSATTFVATTWSSTGKAKRTVLLLFGLALIIGAVCLIITISKPVNPEEKGILRAEDPPQNYGLVLEIPQGKLKWNLLKSREGRDYYAFYKVPYAQPPVDKLRFEAPEPPEPWEGVRHETEVAPQCIQKVKYSPIIEAAGEEDCLYANIYTPKLPGINLGENELMPVLFYIHGGGFSDGNGSRYGGKYFMDEDAVLITFQYRLGAFGFLSSEDGIIKGNMGMKDQIMALNWTNQNIKYFGGDPKRIMIFGNSAGAMSVNQIMPSPLSSGLFHSAITQSGPFQGSSFVIREKQLKSYESLATTVGCLSSRGNEQRRNKRTLKCLRDLPATDLAVIRGPDINFGMTLETYDTNDEEEAAGKFLPESIYNLTKHGEGNRVPWIIGVNSDEWIGVSANRLKDSDFMTAVETNWSSINTAFNSPFANCSGNDPAILDKARAFYFGDKPLNNNTLREFSNLLSDRDIVHPSKTFGTIQAEFSDVYLYLLKKRPRKSYSDRSLAGFPPIYNDTTSHADELQYLFNYNGYPEYPPEDKEYYEFSRYLVKTWVHFAATGKTPSGWDPIKPGQKPSWFELSDTPKPTVALQSRMEFWDQFTPEDLCYA